MVLDPVYKLSQRYSHCSMEDILPNLPAKGISLEFRRQVTLCLLKADEETRNRPDSESELPQDVRFDKINHFRGPTF